NLSFAISYGSRKEIVLAAQTLAKKVLAGEMNVDQITEKSISASLMTANTPDPDLIIRTSGESRLSNFLMWQASYSELYFSPVLWPDYSSKDFNEAIQFYLGRERRFGKVFQKNEESFI
ncbi:MAG: polyprenyl diphosphate synthase, partial [Pseudobdellovibrio sp.]